MNLRKVPLVMPQKPDNIDEISSSLASFYKDLGWNPNTGMLDVRKIKITEQDYKEIANMYLSVDTEDKSVSMFLVNYMPSATGSKAGYVEIEHGAF